MPASPVKPAYLAEHLRRCGYKGDQLVEDYQFDGGRVPLAGFVSRPYDARSACIAVIDSAGTTAIEVARVRVVGAPIVFVCKGDRLEWWKQTTKEPERKASVTASQLPAFFDEHKNDFSPRIVYDGKTRRRLPGEVQLHFVDAGLMPLVEREAGEHLSRLMVRVVKGMEEALGRQIKATIDVNAVYKSAFWLLAAKMLHDKQVPDFKTIDLDDIDDVFRRVGLHYGDTEGLPPGGPTWRNAIGGASKKIGSFAHLGNVSTEALAYLYENALVPDAVRDALGTHSTPSALVDYMVWQLWPWIEAMPEADRHVFEPACGHGAFLVGMLRQLRQWSKITDGKARHDYLRTHLHGLEYDGFALEIAKLSMTLADIPFGNTWDLRQGDMYVGDVLERQSRRARVLLANPPYEKFTPAERRAYRKSGVNIASNTKACEMLRRAIPSLENGSCFGVVVPIGFLHSQEATPLRHQLLTEFELEEVSTFEDKLFEKGNQEIAVLLGRRVGGTPQTSVRFRRVRNADIQSFRDYFGFSTETAVGQGILAKAPKSDMRVPELDEVWAYLSNSPVLSEIASVGQGLIHKGALLPAGAWTTREPSLPNDALGFSHVPADLAIYGLPALVGVNLSPDVIRRKVSGLPSGKEQVLINYAPVSRNQWRIKATLDGEGHALTSRFIAVRPRRARVSAVYLWALLNSPVANAFVYCHLRKRDIIVGTLRKLPLPPESAESQARIEQAALRYRKVATARKTGSSSAMTQALLTMDAAVLQAYDLPPRLERQLLDLFKDAERKGVGVNFQGYYPAGMNAFVPLHELISDEYVRSKLGRYREGGQPVRDPEILAALRNAATFYGEE